MSRVAWISTPTARIAAAASITTLDGFDAFSLSLMTPLFSRALHIDGAWLGPIFASATGGMIVGAFVGGALADTLGRLRALMITFALFGIAALTMPFVEGATDVIINRFVAGVGLGGAAPIAVALLNREGEKPPTEFVVSLVWVGIGVGGTLAALFNYLFVAEHGWKLMFLVGGIAPIPVAAFAYAAFRSPTPRQIAATRPKRPSIAGIFLDGQWRSTLTVAAMFFLGFITTSIVVSWLPTILTNRGASALTIAVSFAGINGGAILTTVLFGMLAARGAPGLVRTCAWTGAGICGVGAAAMTVDADMLALMATLAAMVGAGGQALSVGLANALHRSRGLQSTSVGFMAASGRLGQFCALGLSSALVAATGHETAVFVLAGVTACAAALLSAFIARKHLTWE